MKERPVLFSAPMVRAILEGRKTQTRRAVKITNRTPGLAACLQPADPAWVRKKTAAELCPYGQPGDRLWVREAWAEGWTYGGARRCVFYRATLDGLQGDAETGINHDPKLGASPPNIIRWRPSIHMPRWASRILLEVTTVRVERLQDISEADAIAEGILEQRSQTDAGWVDYWPSEDGEPFARASEAYRALWESINGPSSWTANPWVWVITFRRIEQ
ncbi:hypothetical protein [Thauera aromatica]|uniref:Phage-related protein n=1 Tax=Thauera aromatica K172 TaxID=44139 RepID=A0A2R4BP99_THAAR|nr:hypothetical protein [Thauera aromatica]AVR89052.1 Phage-related protein [Thauera aromatica K172]